MDQTVRYFSIFKSILRFALVFAGIIMLCDEGIYDKPMIQCICQLAIGAALLFFPLKRFMH